MARSMHTSRRGHLAFMIHVSLSGCAPVVIDDAAAQSPSRGTLTSDSIADASPINTYIAEAATRFDIPEPWIRAVMRVESAGDPKAVSSAGAMGLMQIMPGTWSELRSQLRLGTDPFDPRDNVLAGTAYLRMMHDRFGSPGFLAAYNAGPQRYAAHLATGRPLPRETRIYVASLLPLIDASDAEAMHTKTLQRSNDWRDAPIFAERPDQTQPDPSATGAASRDNRSISDPVGRQTSSPAVPDGLFVRPRPEGSE